jgi:hypothetical protein
VDSSILCCSTVVEYVTMPRAKGTKLRHSKQIVVEFGRDVFPTGDDISCYKKCDN